MITFTLEKNKKYAIIQGDLFDDIREHFSVKNESAKFTKRFNRFIPDRQYVITPTGRFDPGLYGEIKKYLLSKNYPGQIDCSDLTFQHAVKPAPLSWVQHPQYTTAGWPLKMELRDYQQDIVKICLEHGRGTVVLATAGGKTLTMASLLGRVRSFYSSKFKCLLIVPDRGLVQQTFDDFTAYGVPFSFSKWTGDDALNLGTDVVIANLGILQSENTDLNWVEFIDVLIIDECHKLRKSNSFNDIIKKITTPFKFGFTGTLPDDNLDKWNIIGKIGSVLYEKDSYQLRLEKYVSPVTAQIIEVAYDNPTILYDEDSISAHYRAEMDFLIHSTFRNELIAKLANGVTNNCLVLVDFIEHGVTLEKVCKEKCPNKQVYFIQGSVEIEERENIKALMEADSNLVVIAISRIFSTGINIKNLHYIVLAGGGKAKIKTIQTIGRGLRLHASKTKLTLIDVADQLKYGTAHALKRQEIYKNENIPQNTHRICEPGKP
jgi:superfamily II DNA or RNA helicase